MNETADGDKEFGVGTWKSTRGEKSKGGERTFYHLGRKVVLEQLF
jgi:hypothetical protein